MQPKIMDELITIEREELIMQAVLKSLIDLGGIALRKDIKRDIYMIILL